jgi:hypothetical protein
MMDPERLKVSNATKLERRLLAAAGEELPSPELTARMRQAIGITAVGAGGSTLAATSKAGGTVATGGVTGGLGWISAGLVTAAIVGGAAGIWSSYRRTAAAHVGPIAAPAQCVVAIPAPAEKLAVAPSAARHERRRAHPLAVAEADRGDLHAEIALVDEARTALREQSPKRALAVLRRYATAYPGGTFGPEVEALKIEALDQSGEHRLASSLARTFVSQHPDSPLAERVARSIDDRR